MTNHEVAEALKFYGVIAGGMGIQEFSNITGIPYGKAYEVARIENPKFSSKGKRGPKPTKQTEQIIKTIEERYINGADGLKAISELLDVSISHLSRIGVKIFGNWREVAAKKRTGRPANKPAKT